MTESLREPVYDQKKILLCSYIGGPLVAAYMLAKNFAALGQDGRKWTALWIGVVGTLVMLGGLMSLPEAVVDRIPSVLLPATYTGIAYVVFINLQREGVQAHVRQDGAVASGWRVALVTVLGFLAICVLALPLVLYAILFAPIMEGERITLGELEHEVFYEPPVTQEQARRVGDAADRGLFVELGFQSYMKVERRRYGYVAMLPVDDGAWNDPEVVAFYEYLRPELSAALGSEISIVLFYEGLRGRSEHPL